MAVAKLLFVCVLVLHSKWMMREWQKIISAGRHTHECKLQLIVIVRKIGQMNNGNS